VVAAEALGGRKIADSVRFPTPGVGFRAESLIMAVRTGLRWRRAQGQARHLPAKRPRTMRGATEGPERGWAWAKRGASEGLVRLNLRPGVSTRSAVKGNYVPPTTPGHGVKASARKVCLPGASWRRSRGEGRWLIFGSDHQPLISAIRAGRQRLA
jgi:hypothetical protein